MEEQLHTSKINRKHTGEANVNRKYKGLHGKPGRTSLLACGDSKTSADQKLACSKYQDAVVELMIIYGISNDGLGFVFDRGKPARNSYGALKLNNNSMGLLCLRISKAMGFVFDRRKAEETSKILEEFIKHLTGAEISFDLG
ncbi:hypothetical protein MKW98_013931 [Papaver atlanticum]|uniref:Uncharacterized protein n=1 Tax=Papaver atlanticum TaxID=357466 RepID=A0AAD4XK34_9MAGN|nr:hypothetical protein MKW98_013931 [Papaver atlanticum]